MKRTMMIIAASVLLAACLNNQRRPDAARGNDETFEQDVTVAVDDNIYTGPDTHTAASSLDYAGTYKGVLPCADCEGIETVLTLFEDNTYEMSTSYLGKDDEMIYFSEGTYRWDSDGVRIFVDRTDEPSLRYFVGENRIWQLDLDGNRVEGPLAEHYILEKVTGGASN